MNLLEHFIVEIHSTQRISPEMIEVDATTNCWGNIRRAKHILTEAQWQQVIKEGYFTA